MCHDEHSRKNYAQTLFPNSIPKLFPNMLKYAQNYAHTTPNSTPAYLIPSLWPRLCKFFRERRTPCVPVVKPHHSFLSRASSPTPCAPVCAAPHRGAADFPTSPCPALPCHTHTHTPRERKKKFFRPPHAPVQPTIPVRLFYLFTNLSLLRTKTRTITRTKDKRNSCARCTGALWSPVSPFSAALRDVLCACCSHFFFFFFPKSHVHVHTPAISLGSDKPTQWKQQH